MENKTEGFHTGEFLKSEAGGHRSREVVVLTGGSYKAGAVLGKITASGKYTELAPAAVDGSEAAAAVLYTNVDASVADQDAVVFIRDAEVWSKLLQWPTGITGGQTTTATAELEALNIQVR